jgi:type IV pilus assembly protein PilO
MKLSDFQNFQMDRAGSAPMGVKLTIAAFVFVLIVVGFWFFKVNPKRDELAGFEREEAELLQQFEYKQGKVVNLEAYKVQLEEMKEMLRQMLQQLPNKTEMPDLLIDISQTALSTGIDNQKFEPGPELVKEFYAEKPISLRMVGTYHQFGSFVSGVASLPRVVILTMHDISLKPQQNKQGNAEIEPGGLLVLEGTVKTYRSVDEDEAAAVPAAEGTPPAQGGG